MTRAAALTAVRDPGSRRTATDGIAQAAGSRAASGSAPCAALAPATIRDARRSSCSRRLLSKRATARRIRASRAGPLRDQPQGLRLEERDVQPLDALAAVGQAHPGQEGVVLDRVADRDGGPAHPQRAHDVVVPRRHHEVGVRHLLHDVVEGLRRLEQDGSPRCAQASSSAPPERDRRPRGGPPGLPSGYARGGRDRGARPRNWSSSRDRRCRSGRRGSHRCASRSRP